MRIVSLLPSATEMICLLGLGEQLVGVTHECDFPQEVAALPKVTKTLIPHEASSQQIDRLVEATERPKVRIQIMRFAAGPHPGAYGPFHYFRFGFSELPDIVYTEGLAGAQYVDQPVDVVTYLEVLDRMSVQAEPVARTRDILAALRKEL